MTTTTQTTGSFWNLDGIARYGLTGATLDFTETFNAPTALLLESRAFLTGSYTGAADSISVVSDARGGLDIVGTGVFAPLSVQGLFGNLHFDVSQHATLHFTDSCGVLSLGFEVNCACFTAGTLIETESGPRAVETIAVGDRLWAFGRLAPVTWTGSRAIDVAGVADPTLVLPIRIRAGAFSNGLPERDLVVSPDHAVWLDGKLIPARLLVNDVSIVQETRPAVTYFHLALDRHDLILAEGAQVESYLDVAGLLAGDDAAPLRQLAIERPPAVAAYESHGYAPLCLDAALVEPVWRSLAARAHAVVQVAPDPLPAAANDALPSGAAPFGLLVEGRLLQPVRTGDADGVTGFAVDLPQGARLVTILSAAASPWSGAPWLDDRRRLGVAIAGIALDGLTLSLESDALVGGWHGIETAAHRYRWTDGAATLVLPAGATRLEIGLVGIAPAPRATGVRAAA